jgi:hypothetical protein
MEWYLGMNFETKACVMQKCMQPDVCVGLSKFWAPWPIFIKKIAMQMMQLEITPRSCLFIITPPPPPASSHRESYLMSTVRAASSEMNKLFLWWSSQQEKNINKKHIWGFPSCVAYTPYRTVHRVVGVKQDVFCTSTLDESDFVSCTLWPIRPRRLGGQRIQSGQSLEEKIPCY